MIVALKAIILMFLLCASFLLGAKYGAEEFYSLNAKHEAVLTYAQLHQLKSGKLEGLEESLQYDIDHNIVTYIKGQNSKLAFLWPEVADHQSSIFTQAIAFRKENPWPYLGIEDKGLLDPSLIDQISRDEALLNNYIDTVLQ